ncbi:MAG: hypothetical protein ACI9KE_005254 [Polyangiales bacterium]|jgi:hypothetical protein
MSLILQSATKCTVAPLLRYFYPELPRGNSFWSGELSSNASAIAGCSKGSTQFAHEPSKRADFSGFWLRERALAIGLPRGDKPDACGQREGDDDNGPVSNEQVAHRGLEVTTSREEGVGTETSAY